MECNMWEFKYLCGIAIPVINGDKIVMGIEEERENKGF